MNKKTATKKKTVSVNKNKAVTNKKKIIVQKKISNSKSSSTTKKSSSMNKTPTPKNQSVNKKSAILKNLLPSFCLSLVASFMFFIFEPITMYATNPNDFWFDIYEILPTLLLTFTLVFIGSFIVLSIIHLVCQKLLKRPNLFYVFLSIIFCIFVITYAQGNFFSGSLPGINGEIFNWRLYKTETITSFALWIIGFIALIICLIKLKPAKVFSAIPYITGAIFIMLSVSLLSTIITKNVFEDKTHSIATNKNINLASTDQNVFVFLADAIDAKTFAQLFQNDPDYQELFKDFTFYKDTLSFYPYTRDSIPYIFSPIPNHNETSFYEFSHDVLSKSQIFQSFKEDNYNMNFYDHHGYMNAETAAMFDNTVTEIPLNQLAFIKQVLRYDLFKYLPYPLKGKIHIEKLDFSSAKGYIDYGAYVCNDIPNYNRLTTEPLTTTDEKIFHFYYIEGAHIWFNIDENLQPIDSTTGTYNQKVTATFKIIKAYIDRMKKAGIYDNSAIVIMADHGYKDGVWEYDYILDRFNPILYIKGVDEHHDKLRISNKPIAFEDLSNAINDLRLKKKSTELFKDISYPRKRTLMYYVWAKENHMVEYETEGKAWESDKMKETGNVYDLK